MGAGGDGTARTGQSAYRTTSLLQAQRADPRRGDPCARASWGWHVGLSLTFWHMTSGPSDRAVPFVLSQVSALQTPPPLSHEGPRGTAPCSTWPLFVTLSLPAPVLPPSLPSFLCFNLTNTSSSSSNRDAGGLRTTGLTVPHLQPRPEPRGQAFIFLLLFVLSRPNVASKAFLILVIFDCKKGGMLYNFRRTSMF